MLFGCFFAQGEQLVQAAEAGAAGVIISSSEELHQCPSALVTLSTISNQNALSRAYFRSGLDPCNAAGSLLGGAAYDDNGGRGLSVRSWLAPCSPERTGNIKFATHHNTASLTESRSHHPFGRQRPIDEVVAVGRSVSR